HARDAHGGGLAGEAVGVRAAHGAVVAPRRPVAILYPQLRGVAVLAGDVHAAGIPGRAPDAVQVPGVVALGVAVGGMDLQAVEAAPRDEVDHAGHGVGPVDRRRA